MNKLRYNILANYVGQGWSALMGLAFVPLYIHYLGMEAYGLIGLFAVMQAWLTLLDMGITPTLNREMARFSAGGHNLQSIRDLLRSLEVLCYGIAALIALAVWAASSYLAHDWLRAQKFPSGELAHAISIMGLVVAGRFVEGIYRGSLFGLQKQIWYNAINMLMSTIRAVGTIAALALISPTIDTFFIWQGFCSLLTVIILATAVHRAIPPTEIPPKFSREALSGVSKFAGGMMGITILSLLLTQVDKVLLSRLLPLQTFGYYTLAASLASMLYMVVSPIATALYPRMVEFVTLEQRAGLVSIYHSGSQLVTIFVAPTAALLCFFPGGIMYLWTGNMSYAINTSQILVPLVIGSALNAAMWIPYQCQLAHGWTTFAFKTNLLGVVVLVPAIFWVTPRYGAVGAACLWAGLNFIYVTVGMQFLHVQLLPSEKWRWYLRDLFLPLTGAVAVALIAKQVEPAPYQNRLYWLAFLSIVGVLSLSAAILFADQIRRRVLQVIKITWRNGLRRGVSVKGTVQ